MGLGKVSAKLPDVCALRLVSVRGAVRAWINVSDETVYGDVRNQVNAADEAAREI